ncbi:GNAT family N-acetyltransferase [Malaciobacter mytili LMG 24559]|uniref:GNAT family N-acetyltransferase n=1 Tax=Malaciobacter mytili LMG 24559 TaxID=1032238 RepID=A0AAX2AK19_9BACT|nr:GNAT family N-acetyltransferase [Malaciobacter mytili]AXH14308.1 acetyltransferase [Malaciobacter mytili LMG 24559]RXK16530.1 GNAT family N-acetyltransferase [Malaciobacter mytili LMG 24559]
MIENITFKQVDKALTLKAKTFIMQECYSNYSTRITTKQYKVLALKLDKLIKDKNNAFFVALNEKDEIVGSISISAYDNRIEVLKKYYKNENLAEIGRCYILKKYRRYKIASKLFNLATLFALKKNYQKLYLHTHYFLDGGFSFWKKMGFEITYEEKGIWETIHMQKLIPAQSYEYKNLSTSYMEY